jgi:hypothetical protein
MIANVLAFNSSPKRSANYYKDQNTVEEVVSLYNEHFALGESDEPRLAMPSATNMNNGYGKSVKSGKRPRGG